MIKAGAKQTYREFLTQEFEVRVRRNPSYSLRAFARDLDLPASNLSNVMRRKRGLSMATAERVAMNLKLDPTERTTFLAQVESEHARSPEARRKANECIRGLVKKAALQELSLNTLSTICSWLPLAILELTHVEDFQSDAKWIANRLGVTRAETDLALKNLFALKLLEEKKRGEWTETHRNLITPSDVPSRFIRDFHRQVLERAANALERVPVDQRECSSGILAIDPSKMQEAKEALREFRRRLCIDLQDKAKPTRVYGLSIQFFPLDEADLDKKGE